MDPNKYSRTESIVLVLKDYEWEGEDRMLFCEAFAGPSALFTTELPRACDYSGASDGAKARRDRHLKIARKYYPNARFILVEATTTRVFKEL